MERPSIAMIPSAYNDGIVYSVLPINGAGDLTFARATSANTTSTRVESDDEIQEVAPNTPRLDYSGSGCPSFLLEPESSNLITNSNVFDMANGSSDGTRTQITLNNGIEGIEQVLVSSGRNSKTQGVNTVIGKEYTVSFYVDEINFDVLDENRAASFILGESGASILFKDVVIGRNSYTYTATITNPFIKIGLGVANSINPCSLKFGGLQIEESSYATSYIPTSGAIATRSAETLSKDSLSSYINSSEGVLYAEIKALSNDSTYRRISLGSSTTSSVVTLDYKNEDDSIRAFISSDGTNGLFLNATGVDVLEFNQIALKYNSTSFSLWINGEEKDSVTNTITLDSLDKISFDSGGGTDIFYGNIKDLRVYTTALTDTELTQLTS